MRQIVLILSLVFLWANANANADAAVKDSEKPFTVGVSRYYSTLDAGSLGSDDFSGFSISGAQNFTDNISVRLTYFSLEHDDIVFIDSDGYDVVIHFGTGLRSLGFKAYIGGGYFKDTVSSGQLKGSASGLQVNGGLGYNWDKIALDFILSVRDADDFQDLVSPPNNVSVDLYSGSLLLSYRF
jgi:hypothetical protein